MHVSRSFGPRFLTAAAVYVVFGALGAVFAGFSVDEAPTGSPRDPGDLFLPAPASVCDMDDGDGTCPPPSFNVPSPTTFDMDAFAIDEPLIICPQVSLFTPGLLFSIDDGNPGAGSGGPDNATEIYFYDYCRAMGAVRKSYATSITETALGLGPNPPPRSADDDVDAFDTRPAGPYYNQGYTLLFSPDTPSTGGLPPSTSGPEGNIYFVNLMTPVPNIWATPAQLGVADPVNCNIDGIAPIYEPGVPWTLLYTTSASEPCGLDPGDIYATDVAGHRWLWADDVNDLKIAISENDPVDIDALAINDGNTFQILDPYVPPDPSVYKADWPNYAPSGMPDLEQDRVFWPLTYCGPTAVADSFWWFDSELECDRDRTSGDAAETEANNLCNVADVLGETPSLSASLLATIEDVDWYYFDVPGKGRGVYNTCSVVISTCALRKPGDADTRLDLFDGCTAAGAPGNPLASNDNACSPDLQSEIRASLRPGTRYWVKVTGFGDPYTLSLGIDCYPMVQRYVSPSLTPDDHAAQNVKPLIEDLALCMNTDDVRGTGSGHKGTRIADMSACIDSWLQIKGIKPFFTNQTVTAPAFDAAAVEIKKSEDVVLLLGFYWQDPSGAGPWHRCGGHYVTSAGVDTLNRTITIADPKLNNAEPLPIGTGGPGRVRGPLHTHLPGAQPADHDDTVNVSHDRYTAGPSMIGLPTSQWALSSYGTAGATGTTCAEVYLWCYGSEYGQNPSPVSSPVVDVPCPNLAFPVTTEVEAMVDVSPVQTPICVELSRLGAWPNNLRVNRGACAGAGNLPLTHDLIRGKICNLRQSGGALPTDLGSVQCLYDDTVLDKLDEISPNATDCFNGWFYLMRQFGDADYGVSSNGAPRTPSSGGCP